MFFLGSESLANRNPILANSHEIEVSNNCLGTRLATKKKMRRAGADAKKQGTAVGQGGIFSSR